MAWMRTGCRLAARLADIGKGQSIAGIGSYFARLKAGLADRDAMSS